MELFGSSNWLYIILIGFVVGLLARLLKPGDDSMGIIFTTLLGIAGALLGAILLLVVVSLFRRRRAVAPPTIRR